MHINFTFLYIKYPPLSISPMDLRYGYCLPDVDVGRILDSSSLFYFDHLLYFHFLLEWSRGLEGWNSFLVVVLPYLLLVCFGSTIVAPLFVLLGSVGLPSTCRFGLRPRRLPDAFSCLADHCFTSHYSYL